MGLAIGVKRHAHHQRIGLPLLYHFGNRHKAGVALGPHRAVCLSAAQQAVAQRQPGIFFTKI